MAGEGRDLALPILGQQVDGAAIGKQGEAGHQDQQDEGHRQQNQDLAPQSETGPMETTHSSPR